MTINWFGRTYYKGIFNKKEIFKRPVYRAFRMWLEHDIYDKLTGRGWYVHGDCWHKKYRWNRKRVTKEFNEHHPIKDPSIRYGN